MRSGDCLTKGTKKGTGTEVVTFDSKSVDGFKWNGVERSEASEIKDKKRSDRPVWKRAPFSKLREYRTEACVRERISDSMLDQNYI